MGESPDRPTVRRLSRSDQRRRREELALADGRVAPNELTDGMRRDKVAGTPWHKHVPARIEKVEAG